MDGPKLLWRYMPLVGLVRLLQTRTLHLARSDQFEDVLEGRFGFSRLAEHIGLAPTSSFQNAVQALRADSFLSCWHLSHSESLAMWRLYGRSDTSIAIVSDAGSVMKIADDFCRAADFSGMFGDVVYDNFIADGKLAVETLGLPFGGGAPRSCLAFFCKAPAFAYEKEWRLLLWSKQAVRSSVAVPIPSLEKLIKCVWVSPDSPDWIAEGIKELVQVQFGLTGTAVERSELAAHLRL